jgi:hypothetical protein
MLSPNTVTADYRKTDISRYNNNPFIEALPPILEPKSVIEALRSRVDILYSDKRANPTKRAHLLVGLMNNFFQPIIRHVQLESKLSIMLREGYVGRNLKSGNLANHLQEGYKRVKDGESASFQFGSLESTASSLAFIGCSGSGKTTTVNRILNTYPQCIYHEKHNFNQIVYLKIDCPHDGSLKSLCLHFFRAIDNVLDTNYENRYGQKRHSIETLMNLMGQLSNHHAIGLLIIDEIQHLSISKSGGAEKMLNFFVTLVNTINLPVVMIGTPKARFIFEKDFRSARRGAGMGSVFWEQMKQGSAENTSQEWNLFTNTLWKYQWLNRDDTELSQEIRDVWYELSQGILDIVVKIFVLAQFRAIESGIEKITVRVLKTTYEEDLKSIHPMIKALQSGVANRIAEYSDLVIPEVDQKILQFQQRINEKLDDIDDEAIYQGDESSTRLHRLLKDIGYDSELLPTVVTQIIKTHSSAKTPQLLTMAIKQLTDLQARPSIADESNHSNMLKAQKSNLIRKSEWQKLDNNDLRFLYSQKSEGLPFYDYLKHNNEIIFDFDKWLEAI